MQRHRPDLIVLDVMLPDLDGFGFGGRRLRSGDTRTPVLFLTRTPHRGQVTGLTVGGDDYVTKPFSLEEVIPVAASGRCCARPAPAARPAPTRLRAADLELDEESHEVWRAGQLVQLSPTSSSCCAT